MCLCLGTPLRVGLHSKPPIQEVKRKGLGSEAQHFTHKIVQLLLWVWRHVSALPNMKTLTIYIFGCTEMKQFSIWTNHVTNHVRLNGTG